MAGSYTTALERLAVAAEELAAAARAVLDGSCASSVAAVPPPVEGRSLSPTRDLVPPAFAGEEQFAELFMAYEPSNALVVRGEGGFPPRLTVDEAAALVPMAVAGDVALEVAHAGLANDSQKVDALIADGAAEIGRLAGEVGPEMVRAFCAALTAFPELRARGTAWQS